MVWPMVGPAPATNDIKFGAAWRPDWDEVKNDPPHAVRAVENKPGVLVRIAGWFARRGSNIDSLAVGPTEQEEISRITMRSTCEEHPLEQVTSS